MSRASVHMQEVYIFSTVTGPPPVFSILNACFTLPAAMEICPKSKFASFVLSVPAELKGTDAVLFSEFGRAVQTIPPRTAMAIMIPITVVLFMEKKVRGNKNPFGEGKTPAPPARRGGFARASDRGRARFVKGEPFQFFKTQGGGEF